MTKHSLCWQCKMSMKPGIAQSPHVMPSQTSPLPAAGNPIAEAHLAVLAPRLRCWLAQRQVPGTLPDPSR